MKFGDQQHAATALAQSISHFAADSGDHSTPIAALSLHRRNALTEPVHCIYPLGIGVVAQGDKEITVGERIFRCSAGQSMLTTIDMPVISHVAQAAPHRPFLGLLLLLDVGLITQLVSEMDMPVLADNETQHSFSVAALDPALADALNRLIALLEEPALIPRLAPLIQQEIMIRLLHGPHAAHLAHLVKCGSSNQKIYRVVHWLKDNFVQSVRMDELAERAHMSPSTFRQHFRAITGLSPLQYQKQLRLQEARHLMVSQHLDAGHAADLVGYESASQFSREYSRLFGASPQRDIQRMRQAS